MEQFCKKCQESRNAFKDVDTINVTVHPKFFYSCDLLTAIRASSTTAGMVARFWRVAKYPGGIWVGLKLKRQNPAEKIVRLVSIAMKDLGSWGEGGWFWLIKLHMN